MINASTNFRSGRLLNTSPDLCRDTGLLGFASKNFCRIY